MRQSGHPDARQSLTRVRRTAVVFGLLLTALVAVGCTVAPPWLRPIERPFNGATISPPTQMPDLTLRTTDGRPFSTATTRGRYSLFFFGYTNCPDVCPLTLFHIGQIRQQLGEASANIDAYFVTVDPERDTPARLGEYVSKFNAGVTPLTGSNEELERIKSAFGVIAEKRPAPNSAAGYFVDHTGSIFLLDRESRIALIYQFGTDDALIVDDIARLVKR